MHVFELEGHEEQRDTVQAVHDPDAKVNPEEQEVHCDALLQVIHVGRAHGLVNDVHSDTTRNGSWSGDVVNMNTAT